MADRTQSPAYEVLRASSKRLLAFIDAEIERQGGSAVLFDDQLAMIGSSRVYKFGCRELHLLGFIAFAREHKCNTFTPSQRWRGVRTKDDAMLISARARYQESKSPSPQPASASSNATA